jgi:ATP-dependent RNA helicase SUPV3L1/SUV3
MSGRHSTPPRYERVRAVLGPTNTGKTHLAMDRLLAHPSGIIGFPLRLLARENYDRMVAARGERNVALITGEEKIVPPGARWFSCTVEAMPLDRDAEFVAIDEIQLASDPDRGHVFTDRLLHARGLVETMVMGAETIRPLLERLVPGITIETRPRLSQLTGAGHTKLSKLPPRSAIVAFSAGEVYAIAEAIRRRRGGCAVVMGRLSPRTRNAQVALYQQGEVDFLVATDAIGMGLNMDVNHVAFAGLSKYDGNRPRRLNPPEVAQIAGRAGRGMRDGTFGSTGDCPPFLESLVEAVEQHRFDPLEQLVWRNNALDFTNPDALLASLLAPPPRPGLVRGNEASDVETLSTLVHDPEIRTRTTNRTQTRLLWDSCQIPDFRKLADDTHARLCARIYNHVSNEGQVPATLIEQSLATLARPDGDIDTLMQRLSGVRVWAYVAARREWCGGSTVFQTRAREVEDLLSDALHERLLARFVDRRAAILLRKLDEDGGENLLSAVTRTGDVVVEGHKVGEVSGFTFAPDPLSGGEDRRLVLRAARRALRAEMPRRVAALVADPDEAFALDHRAQSLLWHTVPVGRLRPGREVLEPLIEPVQSEFLDGAERERIRARLARFLAASTARELAPLLAAEQRASAHPELRGLLHRLREQAGIVPGATDTLLDQQSRQALKPLGVRAGRYALFLPALTRPRPLAWRALLLAVRHARPTPDLPAPGLVSIPRPEDPGLLATLLPLGWVEAGPILLRLDIAERIAAELAYATRRRPTALPPGLASRLSIRAELLAPVLRALGIRLAAPAPLAAEEFGPPAPPLMWTLERKPRPQPGSPPPLQTTPDNPFAALATLRRRAGS